MIRVTFNGFDMDSGAEPVPKISLLGLMNRTLELRPIKGDRWIGETNCLTAWLWWRPHAPLVLNGFILSMIEIGEKSMVAKPRFFAGVLPPDRAARIMASGGDVPNVARDHRSLWSIMSGGRAVVAPIEIKPEAKILNTGQRRIVCRACEHFTGSACKLFRCCRKREPDAGRYEDMIKHAGGFCPVGKWGNPVDRSGLDKMPPRGFVRMDGKIYPTMGTGEK